MKQKMRVKRSLLKKIKITSTGKILRSHQLRSGHLRRNKSKSALRRHAVPVVMSKTFHKQIRKLLGIA